MIAFIEGQILETFLIFVRIAGLLMVLPGIASARVASRFRLFAAGAISLALFPLIAVDTIANLESLPVSKLAILIGSETLVGVSIGLIVRVYILALEFILSSAAMAIGYGGMLGSSLDEANPQAALSALISMGALLMLFAIDFHHTFLRGILISYETLPLGEFPDLRVLLVRFTDTLLDAFKIALQLGSPFLAYAIIANLMVGFLNKLAVQLPVYFVSLPFMLMGGLALTYFVLPGLLSGFAGGFDSIIQ